VRGRGLAGGEVERGLGRVDRLARVTSSGAIALSASSGWRRARSACARDSSSLRAATAASYCDAISVCWRTWRTALANALFAFASARSASVGSSFTSTWPASTRCVSSASTAMTVPGTCAESMTWLPAT
jgi:hypothetical protein